MINLQLNKRIFNDIYYPLLLDYNHRYEIYYGGAGSGKSVFIAQKLLIKALKSKRKILVIRKIQSTQRESCWRLLLELLSDWKIRDQVKVNKTEFTIELPNGSIFLFKGLDDPEKIKSIVDISDIWCEEATELTEEDFDQLDLRLRVLIDNLQIFISFNPISKANWVYKRWFADDVEINPNSTMILKTTYKDNKFLPKDYIENLENLIKTNITYYRIYALGEFCTLDKLVFSNWKIQDLTCLTTDKLFLLVGLDFGFVNDPSALIISWLDEPNKTIFITKEWCDTGKTNPEIAGIIKSLGFSKEVIVADSAEQKSIEELRRLGINRIKAAEKGPDSVIHGIQQLQQYKIVIDKSCINTITEFENYSWQKDKKTNEYINKPIDLFNHCIDSLRYSLQCKKGRVKVIDKAILGL